LPENFGALRQETVRKGADPAPFTATYVDKKLTISFPSSIEEIKSKDALQSLAIILGIAKLAKAEIIETKAEFNSKELSDVLEATNKSLLGAFYCLKRATYSPSANIPKENTSGWNFAQWYALSAYTSETEPAEYYSIPRATNLLGSPKVSLAAGSQASNLIRMSNLVRLCSTEMKSRIVKVSEFLKNIQWFQTRYVGKRPIGGLYLTEEYDFLTTEWENRTKKVKALYTSLDLKLKGPLMSGQFKQYMAQFNIEHETIAKRIEDRAKTRIPMLLVTIGVGRKQTKQISKGGSLPEKIKDPKLELSVRAPARILFTPMYEGVPEGMFIDSCITSAKASIVSGDNTSVVNAALRLAEDCKKSLINKELSGGLMSLIRLTATVYTEVYQEYRGTPSWDAIMASKQE
jgi:hypothetical protein